MDINSISKVLIAKEIDLNFFVTIPSPRKNQNKKFSKIHPNIVQNIVLNFKIIQICCTKNCTKRHELNIAPSLILEADLCLCLMVYTPNYIKNQMLFGQKKVFLD